MIWIGRVIAAGGGYPGSLKPAPAVVAAAAAKAARSRRFESSAGLTFQMRILVCRKTPQRPQALQIWLVSILPSEAACNKLNLRVVSRGELHLCTDFSQDYIRGRLEPFRTETVGLLPIPRICPGVLFFSGRMEGYHEHVAWKGLHRRCG
jgi:hypothetical protein